MLKFYLHNEDTFSKWVADKLEEMVVAHKLIEVDASTSLPEDITHKKLPMLSDGHKHWTSREEIRAFLEELHQDLLLSQSLQSDTCHLDPDNPEGCL